jgi:glycosyltransferase involved in cell wall biosynthesis
MSDTRKKIVFISEAIRNDCHAPLRLIKDFEVVHFYLRAPYGDMSAEDLKGAKQVDIDDLTEMIVKEKPAFIQGAEPFGSRLSYRLAKISLAASRKTGAKLIIPVLENRPIDQRFNFPQRVALKLLCPKLFNHAAAIICLNKGARRNVRYYSREARVVTDIAWGVWGVNMNLFEPAGPKQENLILYVGRLIEDKGLRYLIEGFALAKKSLPALKLVFIGNGPLAEELKDWAQSHGICESVEFKGTVKNTDLPQYYSKAQLTVYPSITLKRWEEQIGTVNLQSMACGTPVLTTRSGAIPEYITDGEGAMLIEERSSDAIAKSIEKYFTDDVFREKLQSLARPYVAKYDIKKEIAKAEDLLRRLSND